jgi:hypothetical protein
MCHRVLDQIWHVVLLRVVGAIADSQTDRNQILAFEVLP